MNYKFSENEVPFGILQRYGLTQEMVEDLPLDVLQNIYDGKRSPVLPVQMTADDGELVKDRTRFSLVRKNDGTVDVIFYPIREEIDLKNLNDAQRQRLEANKPIIGYRHEGETEAERGPKCFIQLDPENMQVLSVTTPVIGRNLQYVMDDLHLTGAEIQKIQNGEVLTIDLNDELVSVGIDLNSKTGIRYAAGDEQVRAGSDDERRGKDSENCAAGDPDRDQVGDVAEQHRNTDHQSEHAADDCPARHAHGNGRDGDGDHVEGDGKARGLGNVHVAQHNQQSSQQGVQGQLNGLGTPFCSCHGCFLRSSSFQIPDDAWDTFFHACPAPTGYRHTACILLYQMQNYNTMIR